MPSPYKAVLAAVLFLIWLCYILSPAQGAEIPREALAYQRSLIRESRLQWGLTAPVPVMAGQIQQESKWTPSICSSFACGLAQFTPETATWIAGAYPKTLRAKNVMNPEWAIRALVTYDHRLVGQTPAMTPCDNWAFALSAYNGGLGWVNKDRGLCSSVAECNPDLWWNHVELHTARSKSAAAENRAYPRIILLRNQAAYAAWGVQVSCSE